MQEPMQTPPPSGGQQPAYTPPPTSPNPSPAPANNNKLAAGLCGIFLGGLGVHKFILGYNTEGIIMLAASIVGGIFTCGAVSGIVGIIGLIEGIIYLTKTDEEFMQTYVYNKKPWF